ncbi:polysaccharide deacetylase family protein [Catellatospora sp. NPDC049609]|uniref:polysaccharide deacetylase family protein n=1 Tax=Catellatospora sp. NPDC049609 TaxID=3155505 RepID=UPI003442B6DF
MARRRVHGLAAVVTGFTLSLSAAACGGSPTASPWHPASPEASASATTAASPSLDPSPSPSPSPSPAAPSPTPSRAPTRKPTAKPTPEKAGFTIQRTTGSSGVALTFDDGPHGTWTPRVLDALKARGVKATFCLVGTQAKGHPELVRRIVAEGHTLCNHSWNHETKLGTLSEAAIRANMQRTNDAIHAAVPGAPIRYFRHPGGAWTAAAVKVSRQLGMSPLGWTVDPQDWRRPSASTIASRVVKNTRAGGVVLLHDAGGDRANTLAALPTIISGLRGKYRLIRLPDAH